MVVLIGSVNSVPSGEESLLPPYFNWICVLFFFYLSEVCSNITGFSFVG